MQYPIIRHFGGPQVAFVGGRPSILHPKTTSAVPLSVKSAAQRGWLIFPMYNGSKHAVGAADMITQATNDLVQLEGWAKRQSNCGWAVATGHASGVLAVEMKGAEGIAAFTFLVLDNQYDEVMQHALISQSRRGDAETIYVYFRWPGDVDMCHQSHGLIAPGLQLQGEGDFALLPTRISGMSRSWLDAELLVAPQWLLDSQLTASQRQVIEMPLRFTTSPSRNNRAGSQRDELPLARILPFVTHTSSVSAPKIQHRVYMSFHHRGDRWHCTFFAEVDLQTPLPRSLNLATPAQVVALVGRVGGLLNLEIRKKLDLAIAAEQGGVFLNLNADQYAQLQKHARPKARAQT